MVRVKKVSPTQTVARKIQSLPGTLDIVTDADALWDVLNKRYEKYVRSFGFARLDLPFLEDPQLYSVFSPELSEALLAVDSGRPAVLRAALLPQVLRTYHTSRVAEIKPLSKWAFSGQTIRLNQKHQPTADVEFGFAVFGQFTHLTEAQGIGAAWEFLTSLGFNNLSLEINTTGSSVSQSTYQAALTDFLKPKKYDLCDSCVAQLPNRSLQILRCNQLGCQALLADAPIILDFLDDEARKHFTNILEALEELQIPYQLNSLYAGVAGTTATSCAIRYKDKHINTALAEGAYFNDIAKDITGKPYTVFALCGSLLKVYEVLQRQQVEVQREAKNEVYLVPLGELAAKKSLRLFRDLISAKISVYDHFGNAGVKSQLKAAQESKSPIALIMGQKEAMDEMVILRDVKSGMQEMFPYDKIIDEVKKRLGK